MNVLQILALSAITTFSYFFVKNEYFFKVKNKGVLRVILVLVINHFSNTMLNQLTSLIIITPNYKWLLWIMMSPVGNNYIEPRSYADADDLKTTWTRMPEKFQTTPVNVISRLRLPIRKWISK